MKSPIVPELTIKELALQLQKRIDDRMECFMVSYDKLKSINNAIEELEKKMILIIRELEPVESLIYNQNPELERIFDSLKRVYTKEDNGIDRELTNELDVEITKAWDEYLELHKELDTHRGKPIDDTNLDEVNRVLKTIQEKFAELYPAYNFIATRHQYVSNAVTQYNEFIETLKKSGAKQNEPTPTIITS